MFVIVFLKIFSFICTFLKCVVFFKFKYKYLFYIFFFCFYVGSEFQYLEACLFAFKEVAENVDVKDNNYIPKFMDQLQHIPLQHMKIISAVMEAIGMLCLSDSFC